MDTRGKVVLLWSKFSLYGQSVRAMTAILGSVAGLLILTNAGSPPAFASDVPVGKGDHGPCTADFTVTDAANKPLYDAKINVTIFYGFKKQLMLEVGTNGDGKARFEGLPAKVKKPLEFKIRSDQMTKSLTHNPAVNCNASFTVALGSQ